MTTQKDCLQCEGTGKVVLARSWFVSDGFRFGKCGICSGTGKSNYNPGQEWLAGQRRLCVIFCVET